MTPNLKELRTKQKFFPGLLSIEEKMMLRDADKKKKLKRTKSGILVPDHVSKHDKGLIIPDDILDEFPNGITDFDVRALMDSAEDPLTGTLRDLKIDDRDLPLAKNFYDFVFNIIGKDSNPPWAKQFWIGAMLFGEICPVCSDKRWLHFENVPKGFRSADMPERLQFLEHGKCPKCKNTKYELIKNHNLRNYQELVLLCGQRSGKSEELALLSHYQTHRYLKFPKLSTLTKNLQDSTVLTGTFVGLTLTRSIALLWTPYLNKIKGSKWHQEYHKMLDYEGKKLGVELYRQNSVSLTYHHKGLRFYPSSPNGPVLRGDSRILAAIDELALFPQPKASDDDEMQTERANADEAHKSLTNSLATVQAVSAELLKKGMNAVPNALMFSASSPISPRDKMMRLLRASREGISKDYMLGIHSPTWEFNPSLERDSPVIALAYEANFEKAERDFGANPPSVHSSFISVKQIKENIFIGNPNSHEVIHKFDMAEEIYGTLRKINTIKYPCVMSLDAGQVNNAFAIVLTYYDFDTGKTVSPCMLEVVPQEGRRINFNKIYTEIILPLCKEANCVAVLADRWNSLDFLHRVKEDMGNLPDGKPKTVSTQYSVKKKDFELFLSLIDNKNLILPRMNELDKNNILEGKIENWASELLGKPVAHCMLQMLTIRDVGAGRCPEKGEGYTDDVLRALVLGATKIHNPKVMELLLKAKNRVNSSTMSMPKPVFVGRSGVWR